MGGLQGYQTGPSPPSATGFVGRQAATACGVENTAEALRTAEGRGVLPREVVDQASDSLLQRDAVEVEQQADGALGEAEICEQLRLVYGLDVGGP